MSRILPGTFPDAVAAGKVAGLEIENPTDSDVTKFAVTLHNWLVKSLVIFSFLQVSFAFFCCVTFFNYSSYILVVWFCTKWWFVMLGAFLPFMSFVFYWYVRVVGSLWNVDAARIGIQHTWFLSWFYSLGYKAYALESRHVLVPSDWHSFFSIIAHFFYVVLFPLTRAWKYLQEKRGVPVVDALMIVPGDYYTVLNRLPGGSFDWDTTLPLMFINDPEEAKSETFIRLWDDEVVDKLSKSKPFAMLSIIMCRFWAIFSLSTLDVLVLPVWFGLFIVGFFYMCSKIIIGRFFLGLWKLLLAWFFMFWFVVFTPVSFWEPLLLGFMQFIQPALSTIIRAILFLLSPFNLYKKKVFLKLIASAGFMWCFNCFVWVRHEHRRRAGRGRGDIFATKTRMQARFTAMWINVQRVVADISLPSYIRSAQVPFGKESIEKTLQTLEDLGWPVNVRTRAFSGIPEDAEFPGWEMTGITFDQGMRKLMTFVDKELEQAEIQNEMVYKRSESYQSLANELRATSRYFKVVDYKFADLQVDDVWALVGEIFSDSRLTPFKTVIRRWEKKYGLGAFFRKPSKDGSRDVKLKRKDFIEKIGRRDFEKLWARTFTVAQTMNMPAAVSVKAEALPPKKWMADKVRTVIGAPLTHYITSTVFNYAPNHNFRPFSTPIKVGLPLSGFGMSHVYSRHSLKDFHFAGDCSEFDSTISGRILEIVQGVRKKGFTHHRDYKRICDLIDYEYKLIQNQPLALTSRGAVYNKGTGLTTGHSSTSMDNSIAMVSLYLMAWKQLTGLSAHDFRHHVELSVYGDDNLISWSRDAPPTWTFPNIQAAMAQWGVTMNLEGKGELDTLEFLSKYARKPTQVDRAELKEFGVRVPDWIVFHNPSKLVGKLKAPVKTKDKVQQAIRLKGYLLLCAHNRKLYDEIIATINLKVQLIRKTNPTYKLAVPSYEQVLKMWYEPSDKPTSAVSKAFLEDLELDPADDNGELLEYGSVTIIDAFLSALSRITDIVNPDVYNSSFTNFIQRPLLPYTLWAVRFIREANFANNSRHVAQLLNKSCYQWLSSEVEIPMGEDPRTATARLIKHWVFVSFMAPAGGVLQSKTLVWIDKKIADFKFLVTGYITLSVRRLDVPFWNIFLCSILGSLPEPELPDWRELPYMRAFMEIDIGSSVDSALAVATNSFFASTPPSFAATIHSIRSLKKGDIFWLQAATGTGKTTTFIKSLASAGLGFSKIIVVVPRSLIVKGVVPYMRETSVHSIGGYTQGADDLLAPDAFIQYVTPMELELHRHWLSPQHLIILDEAHVSEPLYEYAKCLIKKYAPFSIWMTATPPDNVEPNAVLKIANVWTIETFRCTDFFADSSYKGVATMVANATKYDESMLAYVAFCSIFLDNASPLAKSLIFVNTRAEGFAVEERLRGTHVNGSVVFISSGSTYIPPTARIIITTSVSDVGVTIPDVDHVISPDVIIEVRPSTITGQNHPVRYRAPSQLMTQRRGRTGRTNNGKFIIFNCQGGDVYESWPAIGLIVNVVNSGVSMDSIIDVAPNWLVDANKGGPISDGFLSRLRDSWLAAKREKLDALETLMTNHTLAMPVIPPSVQALYDRGRKMVEYELPEYWRPTTTDNIQATSKWSVSNAVGGAIVNLIPLAAKGEVYRWSEGSSLSAVSRLGILKTIEEPLANIAEARDKAKATLDKLVAMRDKAANNLALLERRVDSAVHDFATASIQYSTVGSGTQAGLNVSDNLFEMWPKVIARRQWVTDFEADIKTSKLAKKYPQYFKKGSTYEQLVADKPALKAFQKYISDYIEDVPIDF
ncbi:RNA-dependent RNA polymerase [Rhizoctonia solani fusarivirus 3]|uniref:RNA-dependent RNA polymerase n=1 Tax=Rhizoctonia solani fusarivirus 3 TaxID=2599955 RepID=A0ABX5Y3X7_9VIRU|nr:RNA-dependent RNA polymerase [Rhizoctonia solani fusarivirus 3]QDW92697.1 RNA-dependent RNA polymerase [Rhizoctonia solani fusarivirus 3]